MDAATFRAAFPVLAHSAYLNAGTCGPIPAVALDAAQAELQRLCREGRGGAHFQRRLETAAALRDELARLLGCPSADVALTSSTTEGMGIVIAGLGLGPGDEIVTSDVEHPGLLGPLGAQRARGVDVRVVALGDVPDAVGPRTRLVACSHVSWTSGELAPAGLAELEVPVLLDGAQGLGAIPVDVEALGCDAYAAAGQKWLCGPEGTGVLYVSPGLRERLAVPAPGYLNQAAPERGLDAGLRDDAGRYDSTALDGSRAAFALAALRLLGETGWETIHARAAALADRLAGALAERGFRVAARDATTLVSWSCADAPEQVRRLAGAGVVVRDIPGRATLRASVGAWNDDRDLERLLALSDRPG